MKATDGNLVNIFLESIVICNEYDSVIVTLRTVLLYPISIAEPHIPFSVATITQVGLAMHSPLERRPLLGLILSRHLFVRHNGLSVILDTGGVNLSLVVTQNCEVTEQTISPSKYIIHSRLLCCM